MKIHKIILLFTILSLAALLGGCGGSDGDDGSDGAASLVTTSGLGAGTTCPSGGTRIDSGVDSNGNGVLDAGEITATDVICNGDGVIGWLEDKSLESLDTNALYPEIAVNAAGQAIAVWSQDDDSDSNRNVRASHYNPDGGWGTARTIASGSNAVFPVVGLDGDGNAIAVWRQDDNDSDDDFDMRASRYQAGSDSWETPTTIENRDTPVGPPQLALNASGHAIAAWYQDDANGYQSVFANHFDPDTGWNPASRGLESTNTNVQGVDLAINLQGDAIAAWNQIDSSESDSYLDTRVNRYSAAADAWSSGATTIDTTNAAHAYSPSVAMNDQGRIMATWIQGDGTYDNVRATKFNPASGSWDSDAPIEELDANAIAPDVAFNESGRAVAIWAQDDGAAPGRDIRSNRYTDNGGWGDRATTIERTPSNLSSSPEVTLDEAGHALAVWGMDDGASEDIWANRAQAGVAWGIARLLENRDQGDTRDVAIAATPDGDAIAVWQQHDGSHINIRAARFRKD